MWAEDNLVRDFERENHILTDAEKQVNKEDKEKELEIERWKRLETFLAILFI